MRDRAAYQKKREEEAQRAADKELEVPPQNQKDEQELEVLRQNREGEQEPEVLPQNSEDGEEAAILPPPGELPVEQATTRLSHLIGVATAEYNGGSDASDTDTQRAALPQDHQREVAR